MSKKLWVGIAVVMSCASVMASTLIGTDPMPSGGIGAFNTGIIDNFDATRNAGLPWTEGVVGGGSIAEGAYGASGNGVRVTKPGSVVPPSSGGYMFSADGIGTIASGLGIAALSPTIDIPTGDKTASYVQFDFQYSANSPQNTLVRLFLLDTDTSDAWYTDINLAANNNWNSYLVWLNPGNGSGKDFWYQDPDLAGTFDIANLGSYKLGLNILYPNIGASSATYNIDNFGIGQWAWNDPPVNPAVPEPGTVSMLGFALASMGLTFRRRLRTIFKR